MYFCQITVIDVHVCQRWMTSWGSAGLELKPKDMYFRNVLGDLITFDGILTCYNGHIHYNSCDVV